MTYATLREALCDFFLHTMPHLFPPAVIISNEDVFTALPYAKGRRFFDAVALQNTANVASQSEKSLTL